jgi:hypothetical protein
MRATAAISASTTFFLLLLIQKSFRGLVWQRCIGAAGESLTIRFRHIAGCFFCGLSVRLLVREMSLVAECFTLRTRIVKFFVRNFSASRESNVHGRSVAVSSKDGAGMGTEINGPDRYFDNLR